MSPKKPTGFQPRTTPLWIISLFVTISEIVSSVTVIRTEGAVQVIAVLFLAVFTIGVAASFFYILWARSEVLFHPSEYSGVDMAAYVKHVSGRRNEREKDIVEAVTDKVVSKIKTISQNPDIDRDTEIEELAAEIKQRFVRVVFPKGNFNVQSDLSFDIYLDGWGSVQEFLNTIYLNATNNGLDIPIWTYGIAWQLRNKKDDKIIKKLVVGRVQDLRPFMLLGMSAGDTVVGEEVSRL